MLLDFVAGCPTKSLQDLKVVSSSFNGGFVPLQDVLSRVMQIENRLAACKAVASPTDDDWAFLMLVRDALNALIRPASGMTVAYTAMVVGNRRGRGFKSRAKLAEQAYAGLRGSAWFCAEGWAT